MRTLQLAALAALLASFGSPTRAQEARPQEKPTGLLEARKGFTTKLARQVRDDDELEAPPAALFEVVRYKGPLGEMKAVLGKPPAGAKGRLPAILWVTGGFPPGGCGSSAWSAPDLDNEQSAQAYRHAGLIMMYPTFRGSFGNPGHQESFLGEVDDLLAAASYLAKVPYVDPERIYLGGHSTGGTLALLAAMAGGPFKAVISFGPVGDPVGYGDEVLTFDPKVELEARVRAPIHYLAALRVPTYVIEGDRRGNVESLRALKAGSKNPLLRCFEVRGATHFDLLAALNAVIAKKLAAPGELKLEQEELQRAYDEDRAAAREAYDLSTLAQLRRRGLSLDRPCLARHHCLAREQAPLTKLAAAAAKLGLRASEVAKHVDREGDPYYLVVLSKELTLQDLPQLFATTASIERLAKEADALYDGWTVD